MLHVLLLIYCIKNPADVLWQFSYKHLSITSLILNLARLSIYIYLENVHLAHNLEFAGVRSTVIITVERNLDPKMVGCQPQLQHNFGPNVA